MKFLLRILYIKIFGVNAYLRNIGVIFGNNCVFSKSTDFGSEPYLVSIGDNFYSSDSVVFLTHDGSVHVLRNIKIECLNVDLVEPIRIGNNVFLGHSVKILPGAIVGNNVIVGACSVVKGILESDFVYAGAPAKKVCTLDEYYEKNRSKFRNTKRLNFLEKREFYRKIYG